MTDYLPQLEYKSDDQQKHTMDKTSLNPGNGCTSTFILPPLTVLLVGSLLLIFSLNFDVATILDKEYFRYLEQADTNTSSVLFINQGVTTNRSEAISSVFTQEVQAWGPSIYRWARQAGIEPNLAAVVMQIESCGNPHAISRSGAMGLFQVMPFHFTAHENPYDPEINALRGLDYLSRSLATAHGNVRTGLAGYNGGIGVIGIPEYLWKEQTVRYITYGFPIYQDAMDGRSSSTALKEWYSSYGANLCREAAEVLGIQDDQLF